MMKDCHFHNSDNILNKHHLEGDVWAHTMMSYNSGILNGVSTCVLWALLLHDIGRVLSRVKNDKKGTVSFGYYEGISCFVSLEILNETNLSDYEKSRILKIISYQYTIIDHIRYDTPSQDELIEIFKYEEQTLKDLAKYARCDLFGRVISESVSEQYSLEKIQNSINYTSTLEQKQKSKNKNIVYILVGAPCSRKSTWVKNQKNNFLIINRDTCVEQVGKKYGKNNYNSAFSLTKKDKKVKQEVDEIYDNLVKFVKNSNNARLMTRDKSLSEKGLKDKFMTFTYPLFNEGFDEIGTVIFK